MNSVWLRLEEIRLGKSSCGVLSLIPLIKKSIFYSFTPSHPFLVFPRLLVTRSFIYSDIVIYNSCSFVFSGRERRQLYAEYEWFRQKPIWAMHC